MEENVASKGRKGKVAESFAKPSVSSTSAKRKAPVRSDSKSVVSKTTSVRKRDTKAQTKTVARQESVATKKGALSR